MHSFRHPGTVLTDHVFTVPLDHGDPAGPQIEVFAREVAAAAKAGARQPWLVFLQGGPGGASPRPVGRESWLDRALEDYRVLLLDQRGTGRSTPATRQTLAGLGSARAQADYLANFRADSIIKDAEIIRRTLIGDEPWTALGQSYGGFCATTYLSLAPEGLREVLITGGVPGLEATAEDVYRATYPRVAAKTAAHYERYPDDAERARQVARHLRKHDVRMPNGAPLTVEAFQSLGMMLGMSTGSDAVALPARGSVRRRENCPTRSSPRSSRTSPSTPRSTRCCMRPATPRAAARPAGPRSGCGRSSPGSTRRRRWTATPRCCSPAR